MDEQQNKLIEELIKASVYDSGYGTLTKYINETESYMRDSCNMGLLEGLQEYFSKENYDEAAEKFINGLSEDTAKYRADMQLDAELKKIDKVIDLINKNMPHMTLWLDKVSSIKEDVMANKRVLSHSEIVELSDIYRRVK